MTTWTHEQTKSSPTLTALTYDSAVKVGSLLICALEADGSTGTMTVSDSSSHIWTEIRQTDSPNNQRLVWWYTIATVASAITITPSPLGFNFANTKITEWSVDSGTISLDAETGNYRSSVAAGTDALTSGSITTAQNDELVLGLFGSDDGGGGTITEGTNFTMRDTGDLSNAGTGDECSYESRVLSTAGSVQSTFTNSATISGLVFVAAFKVTGGGGGGSGDTFIKPFQIY